MRYLYTNSTKQKEGYASLGTKKAFLLFFVIVAAKTMTVCRKACQIQQHINSTPNTVCCLCLYYQSAFLIASISRHTDAETAAASVAAAAFLLCKTRDEAFMCRNNNF